ncbi:hypothetical protein [Solirubrobacter soli]|uniref:hypothetical protein n=1 Tax=Solirubrobacter soli TaxID=363832 RepID=UPI0012F8D267|nr:hypothetical protein [Solirubrobacter soli]
MTSIASTVAARAGRRCASATSTPTSSSEAVIAAIAMSASSGSEVDHHVDAEIEDAQPNLDQASAGRRAL